MSVPGRSLVCILLLGLMISVAGGTPGSHAPDSPQVPSRFSLSNGVSMELPAGWVKQRDRDIPPHQLLQVAAPDIQFTEFLAAENRESASLAQLALSSNPFFGSDARTLDARMHQANSLANHFFFFFFPPPDSCLAQARAAYRQEQARREAAQLEEVKAEHDADRKHFVAVTPPDVHIARNCQFAPALADFFAEQISAGVTFSRSGGVERAGGILHSFEVPPMEQLEAGGMTFYIFEAQGQRFVEQQEIEKFRLPQHLLGAEAHFFWAIGARSPFPFAAEPARSGELLVHATYATLSVSGDARRDFLALLRTIR